MISSEPATGEQCFRRALLSCTIDTPGDDMVGYRLMRKTHGIMLGSILGLVAIGVVIGVVVEQRKNAAVTDDLRYVNEINLSNEFAADAEGINDLLISDDVNNTVNAAENSNVNSAVVNSATVNTNVRVNTNTTAKPKNTNVATNKNTNTAANKNTNVAVNHNTNTTTNTSTNTSANTNSTNTNTSLPPAPGEIRFSAYTTGYGWPDNTPPGGAVSNPVIHSSAGGTGTYSDPITLAVGHSIISGQDYLDYPAGTKFYIPALRRYFIVEDTCGDGNAPQNGPCHTSDDPNHPQLDLWVGGQGAASAAVFSCESAITEVHLVIQHPASTYRVVSGPIYSGTCSALYGDTVLAQ